MAKQKKKYTDADLVALVREKTEISLNAKDGELSQRRMDNLKRYMGAPYGDEKKGQSTITTRECMEAVEWTLPSLMRVFTSSDKIVEFIPVGPDDEDAAKQESEYVNHVFTKQNDGFANLFIWIKDGLINHNSYIKVYWEKAEIVTTEEYSGLLAAEVAEILEDPEMTLVAATPIAAPPPPPGAPPAAQPNMGETFDAQFKRKKNNGKVIIAPIPPEEIRIDADLATVSLENCRFVCHVSYPTRSLLRERGYPAAVVDSIPRYAGKKIEGETQNRRFLVQRADGSVDDNDDFGTENEQVEVNEAYMYLDYDGDGIAEYRMITTAGDKVLENEEIDYLPIVSLCSVPMPHTHVGLSWQELVQGLQQVYTTLTRQFLNNLYRTNNPRTVVGRGVNLDDVINDLPNSPIRAKDVNAIRLEPTAPIAQNILPAFQMLDAVKESRTGVSRSTMGLDADTLSRVTQGAFLGSLDQANQRLELLARLIAEMSIKPLFLKIHQLLLKHQTSTLMAKLAGKWINVNPQEWRTRDSMTVLVGLGTGNKQAQMAALDKVLQLQGAMAQMGLRTVDEQKAYNTAAKVIEVAGLFNPERYFNDPSKMLPQPPQPAQPQDSQAQLVQIQLKMVEVENEKIKLKAQTDAAALQQKISDMEHKYGQQLLDLKGKLATQDKNFQLKARDLSRKEAELILTSTLEEAKLTNSMTELDSQQNAYRLEEGLGGG